MSKLPPETLLAKPYSLNRRNFIKKTCSLGMLTLFSQLPILAFPKRAEAYNQLKPFFHMEYNEFDCIGCGACIDDCETGCIEEGDDFAVVIDYDACSECFRCYEVCPAEAIKIIPYSTFALICSFDLDLNLNYVKLIELNKNSSKAISLRYYDVLGFDIHDDFISNLDNIYYYPCSTAETLSVFRTCTTDRSGNIIYPFSAFMGKASDFAESRLISYFCRQAQFRAWPNDSCSEGNGIYFKLTGSFGSGGFGGYNVEVTGQAHGTYVQLFNYDSSDGPSFPPGKQIAEGIDKLQNIVIGLRAKIDEYICINCGACLNACWTSAIKEGDGTPIVDPEKCTGCCSCRDVCPVDAIE